eukprot:Selendium_serpulae@DN6000_c0_g1_i5.p1
MSVPAIELDNKEKRYYERALPETDEKTYVKVVKVIKDMGAYVRLLEYGGIEGFLPSSELTKRRIRSINKVIRVGRCEVVSVMRVDQKKGYIDCSKKRLDAEEIVKAEEKFYKSRKVYSIARSVAEKHKVSIDVVNNDIVWPLYRNYPHAFDALKDGVNTDYQFLGTENCDPGLMKVFVDEVKARMQLMSVRLRVRFDTWCFGVDGVNAVKALKKGRECSVEEYEVKLKVIAPPQYVAVMSCFDVAEGKAVMEKALEAMTEEIKKHEGGDLLRQEEIRVIGGNDPTKFDEDKEDEEDENDDEKGSSSDSSEESDE